MKNVIGTVVAVMVIIALASAISIWGFPYTMEETLRVNSARLNALQWFCTTPWAGALLFVSLLALARACKNGEERT